MVNIMDAYKAVNKSVLDVIRSTIKLTVLEVEEKPSQVRLEETATCISTVREKLEGSVVLCHNLNQYVNKFYSIHLDSSEVICLDYLININPENIDLTEFGEFL